MSAGESPFQQMFCGRDSSVDPSTNSLFLKIIRRGGTDGAQPSGNSKQLFSFQICAGLSSLWGFGKLLKEQNDRNLTTLKLSQQPLEYISLLENQHLLFRFIKSLDFSGISCKMKRKCKLLQQLLRSGSYLNDPQTITSPPRPILVS